MSTTADELLAMLGRQGFSLAPEGDRIRVAPAARLTAELRELIRQHRTELLTALAPAKAPAALDGSNRPAPLDQPSGPPELPADPAGLRALLDAMTADPAWADAWTERLKAASYANLPDVRRTIALLVDLAAERNRAGDLAGFRSWCRFALAHAAGRYWDQAARRPARTAPRDSTAADLDGPALLWDN